MAVNACNEECTLKEWAPLTDLFQILPTRTQTGLFFSDLKITCVDAITEYIALGTNSGIVYCYDRKRKDLQRMRCENTSSPITVVKIISTVDYMLACGNKDGNISIFQIPKIPPENLPASLRPKNKQVERYTVSEMHKGSISALEWSKNGMKLFSGDTNGNVILTEIDFYMHLCKSIEILNETYEIVQLSYHQQNLLISTTYRSIVCQKQEKWKVCQVGKQDRKVLGRFGGIFYQNGLRPTDVVLYCSRPGLRVWVSDIKGAVQQTLLFKDILNQEFPEVPILNPLSTNLKRLKPNHEASFGTIHTFSDEFLVTYSNDTVYILNPKQLKIVATVSHLRGVMGISINKDEIFILEGERSLIRIGFVPENYIENGYSAKSLEPYASIREFTNKIQSSNIIPAIPSLLVEHAQTPSVTKGEEAQEATVNLEPTYTEKVYDAYRKLEIYNKIAEEEFDDTILFKHGRRKKSDMTSSMCSGSSNSSDESIIKPTVMNVSTLGILPDLRSPDSIQTDINKKEKILADLLNFDNLKIDLAQLTQNDCNGACTILSQDSGETSSNNIVQSTDYKHLSQDQSQSIFEIAENIVQMKTKNVETPFTPPKVNKCKVEIPDCRALPDTWKVFQVNTENTDSPNISLADWEFI